MPSTPGNCCQLSPLSVVLSTATSPRSTALNSSSTLSGGTLLPTGAIRSTAPSAGRLLRTAHGAARTLLASSGAAAVMPRRIEINWWPEVDLYSAICQALCAKPCHAATVLNCHALFRFAVQCRNGRRVHNPVLRTTQRGSSSCGPTTPCRCMVGRQPVRLQISVDVTATHLTQCRHRKRCYRHSSLMIVPRQCPPPAESSGSTSAPAATPNSPAEVMHVMTHTEPKAHIAAYNNWEQLLRRDTAHIRMVIQKRLPHQFFDFVVTARTCFA